MKRLGNQPLISKMVGVDNPMKGVSKDMRIILVGIPPLHFFQISSQMLTGDLVECSNNRPLEQRPYTLNGVCMNVANNPFID